MALYLQTMFVGIIKVELLTMLCLVRNSFENKNPPNFVENLKCPAQNLHWQKFVPIQTAKRSKVGQLHNVLKESLVDLPIQFQTKIINAVQQCVLLLVFLIVVYYQILQVYLQAFLQVEFPYNTWQSVKSWRMCFPSFPTDRLDFPTFQANVGMREVVIWRFLCIFLLGAILCHIEVDSIEVKKECSDRWR